MTLLLDLVADVVERLDELGIDWVLGGSLASTYYAEPRTTIDADVAIHAGSEQLGPLVADLSTRFYVPESALTSIGANGGSFNVIDPVRGLKVDLFVLGTGILDQNQIARRVAAMVDGFPGVCWITAPEDVVLRKLTWWRDSGQSDRQWRDVVQVLRHAAPLDLDYLRVTAAELHLDADLAAACGEADGRPDP